MKKQIDTKQPAKKNNQSRKQPVINGVADKDIGYLCDDCAVARGWKKPKGHMPTMHTANCDVCGERKSLSCWNDWLINGVQKEWD